MAALIFHPSSVLAPIWFWVLCVSIMALIPVTEWIRRDAQRVRFALALSFVVLMGGAAAYAATCPECFEDCCPDYIPYMICWPLGWWPC